MLNLTCNRKEAKLNYEVQITSIRLAKIREFVKKKKIIMQYWWGYRPDHNLQSS